MTLADDALADAWRAHWSRLIGLLIGQYARPDLAEDAVSDAFEAAAKHWHVDGVPTNTGAWLLTAAAPARPRPPPVGGRGPTKGTLDGGRRRVCAPPPRPSSTPAPTWPTSSSDQIFACCHPAIAPDDRVALTLRFVVGLTTTEIGRLLLVQESTMAARLTRAKKRLASSGIPFATPAASAPGRAARRRRDRRLPRLHVRLPPGRRRRRAPCRPRRRGHPPAPGPRLVAARPVRGPRAARTPAPAALPSRHPPRPRPAPWSCSRTRTAPAGTATRSPRAS